MERANNPTDIRPAGETPGASEHTEPNGAKTRIPLQQRYRLLKREVVERTRDLERSRQHIRSLVTQLDLAEERERKQLATELHDHLAQLLALGHMKVGELKRLSLSPKGDELVRELEDVLNEALQYCRTLMTELSPANLKEEGMAAGIRSLCTQMKRYGLEVTVHTDPLDGTSVSESSAAMLLRSVRELLINTVKHAAVKQASIRITRANGHLQIVVGNEGGPDLAAFTKGLATGTDKAVSSGFGLLFIKERMKALNGRLVFKSVPKQRTTATLIVPTRRL
ncbi:MAG TPA: histidine kinase [Anaerolineales bacterium]